MLTNVGAKMHLTDFRSETTVSAEWATVSKALFRAKRIPVTSGVFFTISSSPGSKY